MKICVPTDNDTGLDAPVSRHFGRAPYFALVDSETKETRFVVNSSPGHSRGRCRAVDVVAELAPDAVLTAEIGPGAFDELDRAGKSVYRATDSRLAAALATFTAGGSAAITRNQAVGMHRAHHGGDDHAGRGTGKG